MALIQLTYNSKVLERQVTLNVVLPADKYYKDWGDYEEKPLKTLYLLHGYNGNFVDWNNNTRVQRYAVERNLCLVMPSGENSFYVDYSGAKYGEFIGEELVEITRRFFHLSHKREDTFLGGFSMGGYGALRNGLKYHDVFSNVVCFSSGCGVFSNPEHYKNGMGKNCRFISEVEDYIDSDRNPSVLMKDLAVKKAADPNLELPRFYVSCGTEDGLLNDNRALYDELKGNGFDVTYYEGPGGHEWFFWDSEIKKVFDEFLPLEPVYNKVFY